MTGLFVADCVKFMEKMEEACVDLTITSPHYDDLRDYNGYKFCFQKIALQLYRVTKKGGVAVWVVGDKINGSRTLTSFKQALFFKEIGLNTIDRINSLCFKAVGKSLSYKQLIGKI